MVSSYWIGDKRLNRFGTIYKSTMGSGASRSDVDEEALGTFIQQKISENCVVIFSKTYCSYCVKAKQIIEKYYSSFEVVELNKIEHGSSIQGVLSEMTGISTVPQVFIRQKCVGGCSDIQKLLKEGKLQLMLAECDKPAMLVAADP